jgi:hypothetical protein
MEPRSITAGVSTLSQRLTEEKGFSFIAVEGDWPDCYRINRYVKAFEGSGDSRRRGPTPELLEPRGAPRDRRGL